MLVQKSSEYFLGGRACSSYSRAESYEQKNKIMRSRRVSSLMSLNECIKVVQSTFHGGIGLFHRH